MLENDLAAIRGTIFVSSEGKTVLSTRIETPKTLLPGKLLLQNGCRTKLVFIIFCNIVGVKYVSVRDVKPTDDDE